MIPAVLCFSLDPTLLETRKKVLARTYRVTPVSSLEQMRSLTSDAHFDLILLCHTLREKDCAGALEMVQRRWPEAKVMGMATVDRSCSSTDADAEVLGLEGPAVLLRTIDLLLHPAP